MNGLLGTAGLELRAELDIGGTQAQPYLQATLEQEFAGDGRTLRYALTAAPGIVNQWVLPARPDDLHGRISGGINLGLSHSISLQVNASAAIESDQGEDLSGFLALRVRM